ncbi:MAG: type II/IV secretion system ATPase subunit [Dehalococcoidia bacterium]|nr:type II/IV secretion system ATPase subunit [Dehalococcoidia bacterium]
MPRLLLPFNVPAKLTPQKKEILRKRCMAKLPENLRETVKKNLYLLDYISLLPTDEIGMPEYHPKPNKKLGDRDNINIIYPAGKRVFVHIYPFEGDRNCYIAIEPTFGRNLDALMLDIEKRLLNYSELFQDIEEDEEKQRLLLECVGKICGSDGASAGTNGRNGKGGKGNGNGNGTLQISPAEFAGIRYMMVRDKIGLGVLQPMISDSYIEDISCSGLGQMFIEHKIFKSLRTGVAFEDHEELDDFVLRLSERVKKPVSFHTPVADATLPDGSRINIVFGTAVSKRGSNFTIRKFNETPLSIMELIEFGSLDYRMAAYLSLTIGEGMNCFVSGETASGKTTLLNAITTFIHPNAKIVTIEDTPELQVPHKNWIREVISTGKETDEAGVTMFDLLKAALRQRPNMIMVGEIRGAEGAIAFQAMQTGHSVMATFHAASVEKLIQRLTGSPISVPKNYVDNLNLVVIQSAVRLPNGKMGRRAISIDEIVGYDAQSQSFSFVEVFRWDPGKDVFEFTGNLSSYLLEDKIASKRGIPTHQRKKIYGEVERRAKILETLHKQQGVTGFYELLGVLAKAQKQGLF